MKYLSGESIYFITRLFFIDGVIWLLDIRYEISKVFIARVINIASSLVFLDDFTPFFVYSLACILRTIYFIVLASLNEFLDW